MVSGAGPPAAATVLAAAARLDSDDETSTVCAPSFANADRDAAADAAAAAGDDGHFSLELTRHFTPPFDLSCAAKAGDDGYDGFSSTT